MIHEFDKFLQVDTPLGRGHAIMIESGDNDYYWTVVLFDTLALVTFKQHQIRASRNYSLGWGITDDDMKEILNK